MKPHTEMREGPEALQRFEDTMKSLFTTRKGEALHSKAKASKPEKKTKKQ